MQFIHAPTDSSFKELWIIHELNYLESELINDNMEQIRNGTKW